MDCIRAILVYYNGSRSKIPFPIILLSIVRKTVKKDVWLQIKNFDKNWKYIRWVLLITAILSQISFVAKFTWVNYDEHYQLGASRSILDGEGPTMAVGRIYNDLSIATQIPVTRQALGYSFSMIPFLKYFENPGIGDFMLECLSTVIFFFSWFMILENLGGQIGNKSKFFLWVYWLFAPVPLLVSNYSSHTTVGLALAFYSASTAVSVWALRRGKKPYVSGAISGALLGIASLMHYSYWPLVAVTPLALFATALLHKKLSKDILVILVLITVIAGSIVLIQGGYNYTNTGQVTRKYQMWDGGWHWDHLGMVIPFPIFSTGVFSPIPINSIEFTPPIFMFPKLILPISVVILFGLFIAVWWVTKNPIAVEDPNNENETSASKFVMLHGLFTVFIIVASLSYLSVRVEIHPYQGGWVPLMELRYYAPVFAYMMLSFSIVLFSGIGLKKYLWGKILVVCISLIIIVSGIQVINWRRDILGMQNNSLLGEIAGVTIYQRRMGELEDILDYWEKSEPPVCMVFQEDPMRIQCLSLGLDVIPIAEKGMRRDVPEVFDGNGKFVGLDLTTSEKVNLLFVVNKELDGFEADLTKFLLSYYDFEQIAETLDHKFYSFTMAPTAKK